MTGAGRMAARRLAALREAGAVELVGVASTRLETARALAGEAPAFDDYRRLAEVRPQAVLIEIPHDVQDRAALWAARQGWHILLGGPLARAPAAARRLARAAEARGVVIEAGFEARYKPVWESARARLASGALGTLVAVEATALFPADPASWYYDEGLSGGMPLTHMTYCFLNPLRWLLGEPAAIAARANRLVETGPGQVREETCAAVMRFPGGAVASLTAGYVRPREAGSWRVSLIGTRDRLEILPDESGPGRLVGAAGEETFAVHEDGFARQAAAFLAAIAGDRSACRNLPEDALGDIVAATAIARSARRAARR